MVQVLGVILDLEASVAMGCEDLLAMPLLSLDSGASNTLAALRVTLPSCSLEDVGAMGVAAAGLVTPTPLPECGSSNVCAGASVCAAAPLFFTHHRESSEPGETSIGETSMLLASTTPTCVCPVASDDSLDAGRVRESLAIIQLSATAAAAAAGLSPVASELSVTSAIALGPYVPNGCVLTPDDCAPGFIAKLDSSGAIACAPCEAGGQS